MLEAAWTADLITVRNCSCETPEWPPSVYLERTNDAGKTNAVVDVHYDVHTDEWQLCPTVRARTSPRARNEALEIMNSDPLHTHMARLVPDYLDEELTELDAYIVHVREQLDSLVAERDLTARRRAVYGLGERDEALRTAHALIDDWHGSPEELLDLARHLSAETQRPVPQGKSEA